MLNVISMWVKFQQNFNVPFIQKNKKRKKKEKEKKYVIECNLNFFMFPLRFLSRDPKDISKLTDSSKPLSFTAALKSVNAN